MLVLSRKQNQQIRFPKLGISVEVLRIEGKAVRIGIEAPHDVQVLRGELENEAASEPKTSSLPETDADRERRHELRNRLNSATLALYLISRQLQLGQVAEAETTLNQALEEFADLESLLQPPAPATSTASPEPSDPTVSAEQSFAAGSVSTKRRALLVEDNANERELLAAYLRMNDYEVESVEDGLAAMEFLEQRGQPDLVLLDMQMPRLDGNQTIHQIRQNPLLQNLKVYAISGSDPQAANVAIGERGVDRWFSKPLDPGHLIGELNRDLQTQQR